MEHIHTYDENKIVFYNYDAHVSKVQSCHMMSIASLIKYFKDPIIEEEFREIFLTRAFFIWMAEMKGNRAMVDLPKEIELLIKDHPVTTMASLCKSANIECRVVKGICKSLGYIPGHNEQDDSIKEACWISFYSRDRWHIINPSFGMNKVMGYKRAGEIILESEGKTLFKVEKGKAGRRVIQVDDFWFCLNPSIHITHCFPHDPDWQLVPSKKRISKDEYLSLPYLKQDFYFARLQLLSEKSGILHSKQGKCTVAFGANKTESRYIRMSYKLALRKDTADLTGINVADLPLLVVYAPSIDTFSFNIRFPVAGEYIFETHVSSSSTKGNRLWACSLFKIVCTDPDPNCKKLPLDAGTTGYGFGYTAIEFGLKNPSTTSPIASIAYNQNDKNVSELTFQIDSDKIDEVEFYSQILGGQSKNKVGTKTRVDEVSGKLHVSAEVKEEGEYALSVIARDKQTDQHFTRIVNYLLTTNSSDEDRETELRMKKRKKTLTLESKMQEREQKKNVISTYIMVVQLEIDNLKKICNINSCSSNETEIENGSDFVSEQSGDDINSVVSKPIEGGDRIAESVKHSENIADSFESKPTEYDDSDNIPAAKSEDIDDSSEPQPTEYDGSDNRTAAKSEGDSHSSTKPDDNQSKVCILL